MHLRPTQMLKSSRLQTFSCSFIVVVSYNQPDDKSLIIARLHNHTQYISSQSYLWSAGVKPISKQREARAPFLIQEAQAKQNCSASFFLRTVIFAGSRVQIPRGLPVSIQNMNNVATPENNEKKSCEAGGEAFGRAVARVAVAQICESSGFQSCQQSALDALADIVVRYLRDLGKSAHYYANLAGRTECNALDAIQSMEDMNQPHGFAGASNILSRRLSASATVKDIIYYINKSEEIPFARPVPRFPVVKKRELMPSFAQMGETPVSSHIPLWLPAFPDPHTYVHTPVWNERKLDARMDKIEQARQRRKAERSLLNLQQRLACTGGASSSQSFAIPLETEDIIRAKGKSLQHPSPNLNPISNPNHNSIPNPFLAPPVSAEERAVSPVRVPVRVPFKDGDSNLGSALEKGSKMPSVLEAFAPAIEAAKQGFDHADELVGGISRGVQVLPDARPLVQFKFAFGKKAALAANATVVGLRNRGVTPPGSWFGRDEEKDEKKRRAEQILKAAMENPQDLAQV